MVKSRRHLRNGKLVYTNVPKKGDWTYNKKNTRYWNRTYGQQWGKRFREGVMQPYRKTFRNNTFYYWKPQQKQYVETWQQRTTSRVIPRYSPPRVINTRPYPPGFIGPRRYDTYHPWSSGELSYQHRNKDWEQYIPWTEHWIPKPSNVPSIENQVRYESWRRSGHQLRWTIPFARWPSNIGDVRHIGDPRQPFTPPRYGDIIRRVIEIPKPGDPAPPPPEREETLSETYPCYHNRYDAISHTWKKVPCTEKEIFTRSYGKKGYKNPLHRRRTYNTSKWYRRNYQHTSNWRQPRLFSNYRRNKHRNLWKQRRYFWSQSYSWNGTKRRVIYLMGRNLAIQRPQRTNHWSYRHERIQQRTESTRIYFCRSTQEYLLLAQTPLFCKPWQTRSQTTNSTKAKNTGPWHWIQAIHTERERQHHSILTYWQNLHT